MFTTISSVNGPKPKEIPVTIVQQKPSTSLRKRAIEAMNAGDRFACSESRLDLEKACHCYSEAIEILQSIAGDPENANSLSAALSNRGQLVWRLEGLTEKERIQTDFELAASILTPFLCLSTPWIYRNMSGAWVNLANLQVDLKEFPAAIDTARKALELIRKLSSRDPIDARIELLALRALCDAHGHLLPRRASNEQVEFALEISDWVDYALALIRSFRVPAQDEPFPELSERFYRYGACLYAHNQAQHLEEFLLDHIEGASSSASPSFIKIATEAIALAVDGLSKEILGSTAQADESSEHRALAESLFQLSQSLTQ